MPDREITIEVAGKPEPQGSMVGFYDQRTNRVVMKSDNPHLKSWRYLVALKGRLAIKGASPISKRKPVKLSLEFRLERPASVTRERPAVKPDLDKLTRAILDALSGVVYHDDAQVCEFGSLSKRYARPGELPGVTIRVALCESAQKTLIEA